jgi:hypothetical protein
MEIKVGGIYRNGCDEIVEIVVIDERYPHHKYIDSEGNTYNDTGHYISQYLPNPMDLIAEYEPEQQHPQKS